MHIGGFELQMGGQPYIIAHLGYSFKTYEDILIAIGHAKDAGANAFCIDILDYKATYGMEPNARSAYDASNEIQIDWLQQLKGRSDQCGIDFMCCATNPLHIRAIDPFVLSHKISAADINHISLLREIDKLGKPVFMDVGAASSIEIEMAKSILNVPVIFMYSVIGLPARVVDLTLIDTLGTYGKYVGYSDNTEDHIYIPYAASKYHKACVIEKKMGNAHGGTHALSSSKFKIMVDRIRGRRKGILGATPEETPMVIRYKRRLIATEYIKSGDMLRFDKNFGAYSSVNIDMNGLSPLYMDQINGKYAAKDIEAGKSICITDFQ